MKIVGALSCGRKRGSRSRRTKNNAPWMNGQAVERNEGLRPHILGTKTSDFVHVYRGISPTNRVFFHISAACPRMPHLSQENLSKSLVNTNTCNRLLFFAPKLREPHDAICVIFNVASGTKKSEKWRAKPRFYVLRADYQPLTGTSFSGK
jgi:hypothetical protein